MQKHIVDFECNALKKDWAYQFEGDIFYVKQHGLCIGLKLKCLKRLHSPAYVHICDSKL